MKQGADFNGWVMSTQAQAGSAMALNSWPPYLESPLDPKKPDRGQTVSPNRLSPDLVAPPQ